MNRLKVLVFAPWVPEPEARHAGGRHVHAHLSHLARRHDVMVVAPGSTRDGSFVWEQVAVPVPPSRGVSSRLRNYCRWINQGVGPGALAQQELLKWLETTQGRGALRSADIIEVQYEEMLPVVQAARPKQPLILWCHDVVSSELSSQRQHAKSLRLRLEAVLRLPGVRRVERDGFPRLAGVITFNPDDVAVLQERGVRADIRVTPPAITEGSTATTRVQAATAIAVAAWNRPVNKEGLTWLAERVWPQVLAELPAAVLRIVGGGAPAEALGCGIEVHGFVADLEAAYRASTIAIVPAQGGAGLKFTVAQALSHGLPVVTTTSSARGYPEAIRIGAVTAHDQPAAFAEAVVALLSDPSRAGKLGRMGREWWVNYARSQASEDDIEAWYEDLVLSTRA